MNVAQLIEALKAFSPDARVIVNGYEGGFDDVAILKKQEVAVDRPTSYFGQHQEADHLRSAGDPGPYEQCVLIDSVGGR